MSTLPAELEEQDDTLQPSSASWTVADDPRTPLHELLVPGVTNRARTFDGQYMNDVQYISSYTWLKKHAKPTIAVPGFPPLWGYRRVPFPLRPIRSLEPDVSAADEEKLKSESPFLPSFAAVDVAGAHVHWPSLDYLVHSSTLSLMTLQVRRKERAIPVRYALELVGSRTIALHHWGWRQDIRHPDVKLAHRELFDSPMGREHHRVTLNDYFGLKMLVTSAIAGCLVSRSNVNPKVFNTVETEFPDSQLVVRRGGDVVPQESLLELNSRAGYVRIGRYRLMSSYFGSIPHLVVCAYRGGKMRRCFQIPLATQNQAVSDRAASADSFDKVASILQDLRNTAVKHGRGAKLEVIFDGQKLRIYPRDSGGPTLVPPEMLARFGG